jgi:hypothetical protein
MDFLLGVLSPHLSVRTENYLRMLNAKRSTKCICLAEPEDIQLGRTVCINQD